jgi:hypothetical protein
MITKEELKKKAKQEIAIAFNSTLAWVDVCEREVALYNNISDMLKYTERVLGAMKVEKEHNTERVLGAMKVEKEHNKAVTGDHDDE